MGVFDRPKNNFYGKNKMTQTNREEPKIALKPKTKPNSLFSLSNKFLERPRSGGKVNGEDVRPESTLVSMVFDTIKALASGNIELFMNSDGSIDPTIMNAVAKQLAVEYYSAMEGIIEVKTEADRKVNSEV